MGNSTLLERLSRWLLGLLLAALLIALGWTLLQVIALANDARGKNARQESRRSAYRATATAMRLDEPGQPVGAAQGFTLLQDAPTRPGIIPTPGPLPSVTPESAIDLPQLLAPRQPAATSLAGTQVPQPAPKIHRQHSLVNILLLGSDNELTEDDFVRTDTMIVASLNLDTGTSALLSLPRDLFVFMPHGNMGRLNTAFGIGELRNWQPDGGFGLLRQTLYYNFGINVHYHALVDFSGFEALIDRLGGVDIAVDCDYQDYYPVAGGAESDETIRYELRTLPVGYYKFDGFDALWYARTRRRTSDFDRGRRQQLLLRAMWRAARQQGLLATIPALWTDLTELVATDIPFDLALRLLPHLLSLELDTVEHFTFQRMVHTSNWTAPDGAQVLIPQRDAVHRLMQDFYTPPSSYQIALTGPSIAVYNASGNADWDIVAAERLRWDGFNALALGEMESGQIVASNQVIDQVATQKGSPVPRLLNALNMSAEQVQIDARADRDYDYIVIIGRDYQPCTFGVLPLES